MTTARAIGPAVSSTVVKNLLVAANRCAEHDGHDPPAGSPRALSHRMRYVVCSRRMLPRLARGPTARSALALRMLTVRVWRKVRRCSRHAWAISGEYLGQTPL